ncbi:indole-3-acetaldehyde oxidase [Pieris rapae]|uniref:indole-3-acetaldehyde oxidase n=1 Tax=Pieris rapae TaxID=64459 RepID=UPI001E27E5CE|nr:indole-3-acetaldehyde oxidase [Pieris rapae]
MDTLFFTVNGERCVLSGSEVTPVTSLNDYLRDHLGLYGTKAMCHEGGCGACVVSVSTTHPVTKEKKELAVNSCLVHILSCHQWDITTIEGLGNHKDGYHPLQRRLAEYNGTQCGYCTPGWIMNMHSLQKSSGDHLSKIQIDRAFGGNMCRCTGYRPILDAFKSFAKQTENVQDLEDLHKLNCKSTCKNKCNDDWCFIELDVIKELQLGSNRWFKVYTIDDIFKVLNREGCDYQLVAGNTGKGVYPSTKEPRIYIDISSIDALQGFSVDENLIIGAGMTLTEFINVCDRKSKMNEDFLYLKEFVNHLELVAHVPVRNVGTIGGNLSLKNKHHDFPSDIFLLFETVGGCVTIMDVKKVKTVKNMRDFMTMDMTNKIILNIKLPPLSSKNLIRTYKIMPRGQNSHAIVNAGFLFHINETNKVISSNIVFGNMGPDFIHAKQTENFLQGRDIFNEEVVKSALHTLEEELAPIENPPEPSPFCRKAIALGLFYKAILSLSPSVNPRFKSGGDILSRPVSHGTQTYDTDNTLWPLNQPVMKLEALAQCSGEARYVSDRYNSPRDVHVAFVLSTICLGEVESFDATEALKLSGVIAFYTAKDIPGRNSFTPTEVPWTSVNEEIFPAKQISYYGQPIAIIVANNHRTAVKAAGIVKVTYNKSNQKPILNVKDALKAADKENRIREESSIKPKDRGTDVVHTIKGTYTIPDQYHYTMETQSCTVSNTRRGLVVRSATQWMDLVQTAVAKSLNLPLNSVTVEVSRIGGGYGGKASRSSLIACACALAAHKLNRTATLVLPLTHNMAAIGKRQACYVEYEVATNSEGLIQYANLLYYSDNGCNFNDTAAGNITDVMSNLYDTSRWDVKGYSVLTDKASNTWCRAPGTTEGAAIMEHIMERIAFTVKKDSFDVKLLHINNKDVNDMIKTFKLETKYEERKAEIAAYNTANAWTKKSLKTSLMSFPVEYGVNYPVTISVYHVDGTILISHGGIEMGQGINTKVAQVCAYALKVPLNIVKVKGADSFISPNAIASSGSVTSECVAFATVKACKELLERLEPVKQEMNEPTWPEVVKAAFDKGINLQVSALMSSLDSLKSYSVHGICSAEVIMDVLTGTHQILRVDLTEDTGQSLSPALDVGQIEGAFIMGLGLWTSERLVYAPSGRLLTDRTWNYKPPGALDIPVDFRVNFKRNSYNTNGVLRSKATGEPALLLSVVITHALQEIVTEAVKEYGTMEPEWIHVDTPYCVENILQGISPNIRHYKLN